MQKLQKLILPVLIIIIALILYFVYFGSKGLGSFDDFDTNSNANLDISVRVADNREISINDAQGTSSFYAVDRNGRTVLVNAPAQLPQGIAPGMNIVLHGHLHPDHFHATEVKLK